MSAEKIKELQKDRSQFIKKLYEMVEGDESRLIHMESVGKKLGFDKDHSFKIGVYLKGEDLIKFVTAGGGVQLTHDGVEEVEEAIANPNEPTEHFTAFNIINIGTMNNSQIQQGTVNSTQTQIIEQTKILEIQGILQKISNSLEQLELREPQKVDLKTEIETITAQLKSSKPKKSIVEDCFNSIKEILKNAGTSILATELIKMVSQVQI